MNLGSTCEQCNSKIMNEQLSFCIKNMSLDLPFREVCRLLMSHMSGHLEVLLVTWILLTWLPIGSASTSNLADAVSFGLLDSFWTLGERLTFIP